jgi:hypothetical protein
MTLATLLFGQDRSLCKLKSYRGGAGMSHADVKNRFMKIGATYNFVMHALLALSATHIAWLTDCPLVNQMAFEHRGIALKGLHEAIGTFSRENSDAVLAASLLLSWQATDW